MSLLLLFLPHPATPVNTQTLTPLAFYSIETIKPTVDVLTVAATLYSDNIDRPSIYAIERVAGVFNESTVTYSSATVEYSSSTETYGGADRVQPIEAIVYSIDQIKPTVYDIKKT